jgi:hypothetical protein
MLLVAGPPGQVACRVLSADGAAQYVACVGARCLMWHAARVGVMRPGVHGVCTQRLFGQHVGFPPC